MARLSDADVERAVRMYVRDALSAERIGAELGVTGRTILNHLERRGVELRGRGPLPEDERCRREVERVPRLRRALEALEGAGYQVRLGRR